MNVCTAAQMRAIDRRTIEDFGIPGIVLMERAGLAVAMSILGGPGLRQGRHVSFAARETTGGTDSLSRGNSHEET